MGTHGWRREQLQRHDGRREHPAAKEKQWSVEHQGNCRVGHESGDCCRRQQYERGHHGGPDRAATVAKAVSTVRIHASEDGPEAAEDPYDQPQLQADRDPGKLVYADEILRAPDEDRVEQQREHAERGDEIAVDGNVVPQEFQQFPHRHAAFNGAVTRRFADGHAQQGDDNAGQAHQDQRELPGGKLPDQGQFKRRPLFQRADQRASQDLAEPEAHEQAGLVGAERAANLVAGEQVRDQRIGCRRQCCLSHADPGNKQLAEAPRQAAQGCHQAPKEDSGGYDIAPVVAIRQPGDALLPRGQGKWSSILPCLRNAAATRSYTTPTRITVKSRKSMMVLECPSGLAYLETP